MGSAGVFFQFFPPVYFQADRRKFTYADFYSPGQDTAAGKVENKSLFKLKELEKA
jgi:hypothetical protein